MAQIVNIEYVCAMCMVQSIFVATCDKWKWKVSLKLILIVDNKKLIHFIARQGYNLSIFENKNYSQYHDGQISNFFLNIPSSYCDHVCYWMILKYVRSERF